MMVPRVIAVLIIGTLLSAECLAIQQNQRLSIDIIVQDPDGNPIEGVLVKPATMTLTTDSGVTVIWMDDEPEKVANLTTDKNGKVALSYPMKPDGTGEVAQIGVYLTHSTFVENHKFIDLPIDSVKFELERGFQIAASAVDAETGETISKNLFATTSHHSPKEWKSMGGTLVSPVFGQEECSFRLIEVIDGVAIRFSKLYSVDPNERSRFLFRDVKMFPAVDIKGKLDAKIPRPIRNGLVHACVTSIREQGRGKRHTAWHWYNFDKVDDDGSFELKGMPADSVVQIVGMCHGWTNVPLSNDEIATHFPSYFNGTGFTSPQLHEIGDQLTNIELAMQLNGKCRFTVIDEDRKPIAGANVRLHPNHSFFHSGITSSYTSVRSTGIALQLQRDPEFKCDHLYPGTAFQKDYDYTGRTDENGMVLIENIPAMSIPGSAFHRSFRSTPDKDSPLEVRFSLKIVSDQESEETVQLFRLKDEK